MKESLKTALREDLESTLDRQPLDHEYANMETDALLLVQMCIKRIEALEAAIENLKK